MKKPLISKRFFTNLLIVLFGAMVLLATLALTFQTWFPSADTSTSKIYQIKEGYLYVYNSAEVMKDFSENGAIIDDEFSWREFYPNGEDNLYYSKTSIVNNSYLTSAAAHDNSATKKLMIYALAQAKQANDANSAETINFALYRYRQAEIYAGVSYRIQNDDHLYSRALPGTYESYKKSGIIPDKDVQIAAYPNSKPDSVWGTQSLATDTKASTKYIEPHDGSIALLILQNAFSSAANAEAAESNLLKEGNAPKNLPKLYFTQDKGILDTAIKNYQSQIASAATGKALTLTSPDTVNFAETIKIEYTADYQKLLIASAGAVKSFVIKINNISLCNINPDINSLDTFCSWDSTDHHGEFSFGPDIGSAAEKINTNFSGPKTVEFSAIGDKGEMEKISKTVTVGLQEGDSTTDPTGPLGISITAPNSVDKSNAEAAKNVTIKVSASSLDKKAGHLGLYVCNRSASQVPSDGAGCELKPALDIFVNDMDSISKENQWDASGTPAGVRSIMVKAFSPNTDAKGNNIYITGSKTFSNDITVVDVAPGGGGTGGGGGGGTVGEGGTSLKDWIAEFKSAYYKDENGNWKGIKTIQDLLPRVGGFTMLILAALAVIAIIIAGMRYITSGGDPKGAETGKKALLFAVYGIILAVLCVTLMRITYNEAVKIFIHQPGDPASTNSVLSGNAGTAANGPTLNLTDVFGQNTGVVWQVARLAMYWAEVVAVFFILYASFLYLTSYGDEGKAESAKKTLIWALIGLAFILGASYLLQIFTGIIV